MKNNTVLIIVFLLILPLSGIGKDAFILPHDPEISIKLGISGIDLNQIKLLINNETQYYLVKYEKSPTGFIGAWMAPLPKVEKASGGPVFFYNKHQGKWYKLSEMSVWGNHK